VHLGFEVKHSDVKDVTKLNCSAAILHCVANIEDSLLHCVWANTLSVEIPVCCHQFGIVHAWLSILVNAIVEQFLVFLIHLTH